MSAIARSYACLLALVVLAMSCAAERGPGVADADAGATALDGGSASATHATGTRYDAWLARATAEDSTRSFSRQRDALVAHVGPRGASARVEVSESGVRVTPTAGGPVLYVHTARIGRVGALVVPGAGTVRRSNVREAILTRDRIEERYVALSTGLEQAFRIDARPEGPGSLEIEVAFDGLTAHGGARAGAVDLLDGAGTTRAVYKELFAEDAQGRELPAAMQVRGTSVALVVDDRGASYPIFVDPLIAFQVSKLTTSEPARYFGAVSLDGDTAVVGAPFMSNGSPGAAYVFVRSGGIWSQQAKLVGDVSSALDGFGTTVSVSGDTAVVGAPYVSRSTGAAYVFVRSGSTWTQQATLTASDASRSAQFGFSVDVDQDTVVIGAYGDSLRVGAAYVYVRNAGVWTQQQKLTGSDVTGGGVFGYSASVLGDTALVGAYGVSSLRGAAYVFTRTGGAWTQEAKLHASDSAPQDLFGYATAVGVDTAVIGAYGVNNSAGAAYVFTRSAGVWSQQTKLLAADAVAGDSVGAAVGVSGDFALVGAYGQSSGTGAAYLFSRTGSTWAQAVKMTAADGATADNFGRSVAMSQSTALIGAPTRQSGSPGAAYVFGVGLDIGSPCVAPADCAGNACVDGVCCDSPCTGGVCNACAASTGASADGACTTFTGTACNDGQGATICVAGACTGVDKCVGTTCTALDQCHAAGTCTSWQTGACSNPLVPDATPCDDGNASTVGDVCTSGSCAGVDHCVGVTCTARDACHVAGTCVDHVGGTCTNPAAPDTTPCDDGDPNTTNDACLGGSCGGADHCIGVTCVAQDQCHAAGTCIDHGTGDCSNPPVTDGTACDDQNASTTGDTCRAGVCAGIDHCTGVVCVAADECHTPGACVDHASGACDSPAVADGTPCTRGTCQSGSCVSPMDAGVVVDAGSPPQDAGSPPQDAGSPVDTNDAGMPVDAGLTADASAPVDSGTIGDPGASAADASVAQPDASGATGSSDAGTWKAPPTNEELFGSGTPAAGCSCHTTGAADLGDSSPALGVSALALVLAARRRRRP